MKINATEKCMLWCPNVNVDNAVISPEKYSSVQDIINLINRCGAVLDESLYYFVGEDEIWHAINSGEKIWVLQITPCMPEENMYCTIADDKSIYTAMRMNMSPYCHIRRIGYFKLRKKYVVDNMLENLKDTWEQQQRYLDICLDTDLRDAGPLVDGAFMLPARFMTVRELLERIDRSEIPVYVKLTRDSDQETIEKLDCTGAVLEYMMDYPVFTIVIYQLRYTNTEKHQSAEELIAVFGLDGEIAGDIMRDIVSSKDNGSADLLVTWRHYSADGKRHAIQPSIATSYRKNVSSMENIRIGRNAFLTTKLVWENMNDGHLPLKTIPDHPIWLKDLLEHIISDDGLLYWDSHGIDTTKSFDTAVKVVVSTEYPVDKIFYIEFSQKTLLSVSYVRNFYFASTSDRIDDMLDAFRRSHPEYGIYNIIGCWR